MDIGGLDLAVQMQSVLFRQIPEATLILVQQVRNLGATECRPWLCSLVQELLNIYQYLETIGHYQEGEAMIPWTGFYAAVQKV